MGRNIPRMDRDGLRKLVLDIADGTVLTSAQVPESMVGTVFLPVAMGALSPPEDASPPKPADPELEPEPAAPTAPTLPDEPAEPIPPDPPPYPTEDMELVRWGRLLEADVLPPYQEALAAHEAELAEWRRTAMAAHGAALAGWNRTVASARAAHAEATAAHAEALAAVRARNSEARRRFDEALSRWESERKALYAEWYADLGVIYAEMKDALPRGINGYPMFIKCGLLHREDWDTVRVAVDREWDRRRNGDILGGV